MIIDCHYHFEPKLLTADKLLKKMDECGVDKVALMGVESPKKSVDRISINL